MTGTVTLAGGTLSLTATDGYDNAVALSTGGGTINVGSGITATMSSGITGTAALTKTGAGGLTLQVGNTLFRRHHRLGRHADRHHDQPPGRHHEQRGCRVHQYGSGTYAGIMSGTGTLKSRAPATSP